jgi:hypothetical protein
MIMNPAMKSIASILMPMTTGKYDIKSIPTMKFNEPHKKFVNGEDRPTPRGLAKGVGKLSPHKPEVRWGMQLQRKSPSKKFATKCKISMRHCTTLGWQTKF